MTRWSIAAVVALVLAMPSTAPAPPPGCNHIPLGPLLHSLWTATLRSDSGRTATLSIVVRRCSSTCGFLGNPCNGRYECEGDGCALIEPPAVRRHYKRRGGIVFECSGGYTGSFGLGLVSWRVPSCTIAQSNTRYECYALATRKGPTIIVDQGEIAVQIPPQPQCQDEGLPAVCCTGPSSTTTTTTTTLPCEVSFGGGCWFEGHDFKSCDDTCARAGRTCDEAMTRDIAGSGGTLANCNTVMRALVGLVTQAVQRDEDESSCGSPQVGVGCFYLQSFNGGPSEPIRVTSPVTTCAATGIGGQCALQGVRACACQ